MNDHRAIGKIRHWKPLFVFPPERRGTDLSSRVHMPDVDLFRVSFGCEKHLELADTFLFDSSNLTLK